MAVSGALLVLCMALAASGGQVYNPMSCDELEQSSILASKVACGLRDTLVDLKELAEANASSSQILNHRRAIQFIPSTVVVRRCGGSCPRPSHRCVPEVRRVRSIPVMAVLAHYPHGVHETECGRVEVEEHLACSCDCPVTPADCAASEANKVFDPHTCKCLCRDGAARASCFARGMSWNEAGCRCSCPESTWRLCSTGYVFDFQNSCSCVPISMTASLGLIAAVLVLLTCSVLSLLGSYAMYYRWRTGRALLSDHLWRQLRRSTGTISGGGAKASKVAAAQGSGLLPGGELKQLFAAGVASTSVAGKDPER